MPCPSLSYAEGMQIINAGCGRFIWYGPQPQVSYRMSMKKRPGRKRRKSAVSRRDWLWVFFWLALAVSAIACSHNLVPVGEEPPAIPPVIEKPSLPGGLELPALGERDTAVYNEEGRYTFLYEPACKISRWVAYKLTRSDVTGDADRSDAFRPDPRLELFGWPSAVNADYKASGYDRGHLLPSADRKCSEAANQATFLYSNMAPQLPKLNRGPWKALEEKLRSLTSDYDTLYIVVGTVRGGRFETIGDGVAVPELFFKAAALRRADVFEAVAYVMPNRTQSLGGKRYDDFEVTVDSVERLTGLDLFPNIPDI